MKNNQLKLVGSLLALAAVTGFVPSVQAATYSGKLGRIVVAGTQYAVIISAGAVSGSRPSCHPSVGQFNSFAIDISTAKGKAVLSLAQAALLANKTTFISGAGVCT